MNEVQLFLALVGVAIAYSVIANLLNPPKNLDWSELPPDLANTIRQLFPNFQSSSIRWIPTQREYKMKGSNGDASCRLEIDVNKSGEITEFEYKNLDAGHFNRKGGSAKFDELPEAVTSTLHQYMNTQQQEKFKAWVVQKGATKSQSGYEIEGRSPGISWEFEILDDGTLVELEIESKKALPIG